jgi:hypothetical protein
MTDPGCIVVADTLNLTTLGPLGLPSAVTSSSVLGCRERR